MVLLCFFPQIPVNSKYANLKLFPMKFLFMPQDMESYVFGAESSRYLREVNFT